MATATADGAWIRSAPYEGESDEQIAAFMQNQEWLRKNARQMDIDDAEALIAEAEATKAQNLGRAQPPPDVWTLDQMDLGEPLNGQLILGGRTFGFTFLGILNRPDIQKRFKKAEGVDVKTGAGWLQLGEDYAEVLREVLVSWSLEEVLTDPETEAPIIDEATGYAKTQPLPITLRNILRLRTEVVVEFFLAMQRAIRGEVSGQPS